MFVLVPTFYNLHLINSVPALQLFVHGEFIWSKTSDLTNFCAPQRRRVFDEFGE